MNPPRETLDAFVATWPMTPTAHVLADALRAAMAQHPANDDDNCPTCVDEDGIPLAWPCDTLVAIRDTLRSVSSPEGEEPELPPFVLGPALNDPETTNEADEDGVPYPGTEMVGWSLAGGVRVNFAQHEGGLLFHLSLFGDVQKRGVEQKTVTAGQVRDFAHRLLAITGSPEGGEPTPASQVEHKAECPVALCAYSSVGTPDEIGQQLIGHLMLCHPADSGQRTTVVSPSPNLGAGDSPTPQPVEFARGKDDAGELAISFDHLMVKTPGCNCDPGPMGEHRDWCGFDVLAPLPEVRELLARADVAEGDSPIDVEIPTIRWAVNADSILDDPEEYAGQLFVHHDDLTEIIAAWCAANGLRLPGGQNVAMCKDCRHVIDPARMAATLDASLRQGEGEPAPEVAAVERGAKALYDYDREGTTWLSWEEMRYPAPASPPTEVYIEKARAVLAGAGLLATTPPTPTADVEARAALSAMLRGMARRVVTARADLLTPVPRWDEDKLVKEQGWLEGRCGRCGEDLPAEKDNALTEVLDMVRGRMATDSRDWSTNRRDAWLYGVFVGWECEEDHVHDDVCGGSGSLDEVAAMHGWDDNLGALYMLRKYRAAVAAVTTRMQASQQEDRETLCVSPTWGEFQSFMVVCETCGNKRCPHASDHVNACTGSNEYGQPGSDYSPLQSPTKKEGPRVFRKGDLEPGSDVRQVQHSNSQVYTRRPWPVAYGPRNATTVWQAGPSGKPLSWEMLTGALGGYTLTEVPSGLGGGQTKEPPHLSSTTDKDH